ncbi:hypothetical protein V6N13_073075 [Hibiscus sabdariffa]
MNLKVRNKKKNRSNQYLKEVGHDARWRSRVDGGRTEVGDLLWHAMRVVGWGCHATINGGDGSTDRSNPGRRICSRSFGQDEATWHLECQLFGA